MKRLRKAYVILDPREREAIILKGAQKLAAKQKLALVEDMALLAENAGLTEWPVVLMGSFDESFLDVPAEVLCHLDEGASEMLLAAARRRVSPTASSWSRTSRQRTAARPSSPAMSG